jgi:hypothetical protein
MIGLYQRRCPEARDDAEHYQALNAYADSPAQRIICFISSRFAGW